MFDVSLEVSLANDKIPIIEEFLGTTWVSLSNPEKRNGGSKYLH